MMGRIIRMNQDWDRSQFNESNISEPVKKRHVVEQIFRCYTCDKFVVVYECHGCMQISANTSLLSLPTLLLLLGLLSSFHY